MLGLNPVSVPKANAISNSSSIFSKHHLDYTDYKTDYKTASDIYTDYILIIKMPLMLLQELVFSRLFIFGLEITPSSAQGSFLVGLRRPSGTLGIKPIGCVQDR